MSRERVLLGSFRGHRVRNCDDESELPAQLQCPRLVFARKDFTRVQQSESRGLAVNSHFSNVLSQSLPLEDSEARWASSRGKSSLAPRSVISSPLSTIQGLKSIKYALDNKRPSSNLFAKRVEIQRVRDHPDVATAELIAISEQWNNHISFVRLTV